MSKVAVIAQYQELMKRIESRQFSPVYLLEGEETFFIDSISKKLEETVLSEAEKSFNQSILYGKETDSKSLEMAAKRFPMMADYQLIIVKEAQLMNGFDKLETYVEKPNASTILVLCYKGKKVDKRSKLAKLFQKHQLFSAERLRDYQVKEWIPNYLKSQGRTIDHNAVDLLVDFLGADLSVVHNEIDKLLLSVKDEFIRTTHVEQNVGISKEFNVFELQKALGDRNFNKSIQIAHHIAADLSRNPVQPMMVNIYQFFNKVLQTHGLKGKDKREIAQNLGVNEYFVSDYLTAASRYSIADLEKIFGHLKYFDLRFKGVHKGSATDRELFVEMVVHILRQ